MRNLLILILVILSVIGAGDTKYARGNNNNYISENEITEEDEIYPQNLSNRIINSTCCFERLNGIQDGFESKVKKKWYLKTKPNISDGLGFPFFPYFVGFEGQSIQSQKLVDFNATLIDLVQRVAKEVNAPEDITGQHTLSRFNIIVELIQTASQIQIDNVTSALYTKLSPGVDDFKYASWIVFRDALVEAGTGTSIVSLYRWTRDGYISGEEAAQLISTLTNTAQYPTEEFMSVFFDLVRLADSMNHSSTNSSSILAFTSLIKKVYVCEKSMKQRYPVNVFGAPAYKNSFALENTYLPYLQHKLRQAVEEADSHKIQVYIRSLGNTAHPRILEIYKPYLNGDVKISTFQRLLMVVSLDAMTVVNPDLARSILYRLYLNSAESTEIRSGAVALLMRCNPSSEMLQRMTEATNWDSSDQVNAAVKSAVESAAVMGADSQLGKKARKAVDLLISKSYGLHFSTNHIRSFKSQENLGYSLRWNHIQSSGNIFPSSFFFTLRPILGDFVQRAYKYSWMTSSTDGLLKLLEEQIVKKNVNNIQDKKGNYWTTAAISKMLGLLPNDSEQFEGNIYLTLHGARRFLSFDNHTIEELPRLIKYASSAFRIGDNINYTKIYNQFSIKLAFPTATGLPFVFTLEAPTLVSIVGELRINSHPDLANGSPDKVLLPQSLNLTTDLKIQYASKTEGKLGFVTPFNHQHYLAGYDSNIQINLPLKAKVDVDMDHNKFWTKLLPLHPDRYQKIAEYSTMAYTTKHDILDISPHQIADNVQIIYNNPLKQFSTTFGHLMTGFAFDLKSTSSRKHADLAYFMDTLKRHDLLNAILHFNKMPQIEPSTNYSIYFNPQKTTSKFAKFIVNYADVKAFEVGEESDSVLSNGAIPTVGLYEHKRKVDQLLERSTSGMTDSYAQAFDISAEFEGEKNGLFTLSGAYSRSYVTKKARYLFFLANEPVMKSQKTKPLQMALDVRATVPNVPLGNFKEAIKSDPSSSIVARLNFGEKAASGAEIIAKGHLEKSAKRIDYLLHQPITRQCEREMNETNYLLRACHNVTTRANFMDYCYFRVDYTNVTNSWKKLSYDIYSILRYFAYPQITESTADQSNAKDRLEVEAVFSPELNSLNASLITPSFSSQVLNVPVSGYLQPALIMHPHYTALDRMYERLIFSETTPRCVMDDTYAITFDNQTYPLFIGRCWHALFHYEYHPNVSKPKFSNRTSSVTYDTDITILVRDKDVKQRDMILILGENVIKFHTNNGTPTEYFTVGEEKFEVTNEVVGHYEEKSGKTLIQAYMLPTGTMSVFAPEHGITILYDGYRVEIQASSRYRGKVRGLCGTFDGETANDFTSPKNCILKNPLEFTSTYALIDGSCQGPSKELHHQADDAPCYKQNIVNYNIIKDHATKLQSSKFETNLDPKTLKRTSIKNEDHNILNV